MKPNTNDAEKLFAITFYKDGTHNITYFSNKEFCTEFAEEVHQNTDVEKVAIYECSKQVTIYTSSLPDEL